MANRYMLLIYGDAAEWAAMTPEQEKANAAGHEAFAAAAGSKIIGGNELELAPAAHTVRTDSEGRILVTDGPFAETKEAVGGYYLIEADDLEEVVELAGLLYEVHAGHSGVEIRPVVDHG